jgi:hypothetical protein
MKWIDYITLWRIVWREVKSEKRVRSENPNERFVGGRRR